MTKSRDRYEHLLAANGEKLRNAVELALVEDDWLEFKLSATVDGVPSPEDELNFLRALSGFSNSDGGVLVWGIDGRRNDQGDDVASTVAGIPNPDRFASRLTGMSGELTDPPVTQVELAVLPLNDDCGLIVMHIPAAETGLVRGNRRNFHSFFYRAGSEFRQMPTYMIVDRLGRRPHPNLRADWELHGGPMRGDPGHYLGGIFNLHILISNDGLGIATYPAIQLAMRSNVQGRWHQWEYTGFLISSRRPHADENSVLFAGQSGTVIHPGSKREISFFQWETTFPVNDWLHINYTIFHDGAPTSGEIDMSSDVLRKAVESLLAQ